MRKEKLISLLIILSMFVMNIPRVKAATDEWVTSTVDEDLFYAGYRFEGVDMMYLQGDDMQIRSWFWFEGPVLQARRYVKEAYLEVTTPSIGSTDPDAIMYIYGIPSQKGGTPSNADDPSYINGPYTTNYYQVNLSSFVGPGVKHNITVSRIINEINQGYYYWDGHDIAFVTYSPAREDGEERSVATIEAGHPAKLYVHYGSGPSDPTNQSAVWVNNTNGLDIYQLQGFENFTDTSVWTDNDNTGNLATSENGLLITYLNIDGNQDCSYSRALPLIDEYNITFRHVAASHTYGNSRHPGDLILLDSTDGGEYIGLHNWLEDNTLFKFSIEQDDGTPSQSLSGSYTEGTTIYWVKYAVDNSPQRITLYLWIQEDMPTNWESGWDYTKEVNLEPHAESDTYDLITVASDEDGTTNDLDGSIGFMRIDYGQQEGTFFVVDPETNETLVTDLPDINATQDWIDIYQAGKGENPEDPNPGGGWGDDPGLVSRFNVKLIFFVIGMILFVGTPVWGFATRPDAAAWIAIMMSMLCGVALLWSLQLM